MGERENDSQLVEARAIWDINGAKWSTSPVVINVFWNQQQFIDTKTNKKKNWNNFLLWRGVTLWMKSYFYSMSVRWWYYYYYLIKWNNKSRGFSLVTKKKYLNACKVGLLVLSEREREREREGDELIYIIARVWGSERDNNKYMMERSDFWLCAEEKLSETRPRKIRGGAGGKLKGCWFRVIYEFFFFFKEGQLNWGLAFHTLVLHAALPVPKFKSLTLVPTFSDSYPPISLIQLS